jgi:hypothetical protein
VFVQQEKDVQNLQQKVLEEDTQHFLNKIKDGASTDEALNT